MAESTNVIVNVVTGGWDAPINSQDVKGLWHQKFALVNDYLRFFLVAITLGVIIYWGFLLISAQWDEAKLKKANMLLVFGLVGLLVAVFAGTLVKLVVNFFG